METLRFEKFWPEDIFPALQVVFSASSVTRSQREVHAKAVFHALSNNPISVTRFLEQKVLILGKSHVKDMPW